MGVSRSKLYRLDAAGIIPQPIEVGGVRFWRRDELEAWTRADCPERVVWQARRREVLEGCA